MKKSNNIFKKIVDKADEYGFVSNVNTEIIETYAKKSEVVNMVGRWVLSPYVTF